MKGGRVTRGALVVLGKGKQIKKTIVFQYNPGKVTRTLTPKFVEGGRSSRSLRYQEPPHEKIEMKVELNAIDQYADGWMEGQGLLPMLAALETLAYPVLADVESEEKGKSGNTAPDGYEIATLLLVWGRDRVLPVCVQSITVTETAFDAALVPITADVQLTLEPVHYLRVAWDSTLADRFRVYQRRKERLAQMVSGASDAITDEVNDAVNRS